MSNYQIITELRAPKELPQGGYRPPSLLEMRAANALQQALDMLEKLYNNKWVAQDPDEALEQMKDRFRIAYGLAIEEDRK